ncbi:ABC transporter substrate-binding protein [Paenibacillus selenitireducens]|uniref:ABC transporter substrate-binding protein n=1 Tax=Paenibacillus selenitireducens TaxID=1324314 RepID=A0A1T2XK62_9BACL|nr:extracellular solute-binding protein [Paenibacillus selenitireducens]OPA80259.1 ABC transporter substrate-binding protein [Paenibacillus selenitireducens]
MKLWKKTFVSSMAAVLLVGSITACSSKTDNGSSGTKQEGSGSTTSSEQKVTKLKMLGPAGINKYIKFDDRDKYPVWAEIDKLLKNNGLELDNEMVPAEQYEVVLKTRMASGSNLPDIVNISKLDNTTVLNLAKQGVLLDLNPLIEKYSNGNIKKMYDVEFPYAKKSTTSPDGKMYWFSNLHKKTYQGKDPAPVSLTMLIRKDWLDKLHLPVPTTADEYLETLKKFRELDANGNGKKDEVLVYNYPGQFTGAIAQWFGLGTGVTAVDVENKKVVSPWYQEGVKDYFRYMQRLVKEGVLDTSLIEATGEQNQQKITDNQVASLHDYNLENYVEPTIRGGGEFLPLMPLKAVEGITPAVQQEPHFLIFNKYAITKDCKDIEAAIKFFDMVYSDKYADLMFWGIEGQTYKVESNGAKIYLNNGPAEELAKTKQVTGNMLMGDTVFPRVQFSNLEFELSSAPKYKADNELQVLNYKPYFVNMNNNFLAIPDDKQLETKTKILTNLNTYSTELATKLALGQKSLDDWDQYIAELKKLGLDQLIEIDQQLLDRYNSIQ